MNSHLLTAVTSRRDQTGDATIVNNDFTTRQRPNTYAARGCKDSFSLINGFMGLHVDSWSNEPMAINLTQCEKILGLNPPRYWINPTWSQWYSHLLLGVAARNGFMNGNQHTRFETSNRLFISIIYY